MIEKTLDRQNEAFTNLLKQRLPSCYSIKHEERKFMLILQNTRFFPEKTLTKALPFNGES